MRINNILTKCLMIINLILLGVAFAITFCNKDMNGLVICPEECDAYMDEDFNIMLRIIGIMFVVGVLVLIRQCMFSKKPNYIMNIVFGAITAFLSVDAAMAFVGLKKINHGDYAPENVVYLQQMDIGSVTMYVAALVMISLVITSILGIVKNKKDK